MAGARLLILRQLTVVKCISCSIVFSSVTYLAFYAILTKHLTVFRDIITEQKESYREKLDLQAINDKNVQAVFFIISSFFKWIIPIKFAKKVHGKVRQR